MRPIGSNSVVNALAKDNILSGRYVQYFDIEGDKISFLAKAL